MGDISNLLIWGGTGQAKVLAELTIGQRINLVAIVDNRAIESPIFGVPILKGELGLDKWLSERCDNHSLVGAVAIGGSKGSERLKFMEIFHKKGIPTPTFIHRTSFVADSSTIDQGCQILANTSICTHVKIGRAVIINTCASVDHDCTIGDGVHVGPGARLAGEIRVGSRTFIGTGAIIGPGVTIGDDVVIGAGSVVLNDVGSGVVMVGNPAKLIAS